MGPGDLLRIPELGKTLNLIASNGTMELFGGNGTVERKLLNDLALLLGKCF